MTPERFEVTYRPDNQWLHRKLDRKRYAQLLLYLVIGIFALTAAVAATWPHLEAIRLGYRVEELRLERDQLEKDIERYRLELGELTHPRSVERLARETYGLEPAGERGILQGRDGPARPPAGPRGAATRRAPRGGGHSRGPRRPGASPRGSREFGDAMSPGRRKTGSGGWKPPPNSLFPDLPAPLLKSVSRGPSPGPKRRRERAPAVAPETARPPGRTGSPEDGGRAGLRRRVMVGVVLIGVWGALILGQLVQIQLLDHETMVRRADSQHHHELTIPPFRGRIYDRNGRPLALTVAVDSVYAVPPDYSAATIPAAASRLSACLEVPTELVERRLRRASRFSWLKRKATAEQVACAMETGFPVGTIEEFGRFYPGRELGAHVLGFIGADGDGLGGIEFALDGVLRGEPGRRTVWTDGRRTERESRVVRESRPGADVELTIDSYLQAVAEEELERAVAEVPATSGAVILVEPQTGEVLAMANAPSFDPNRARDFPPATLANRSITDPYEPGSVFKIFTAAAALEEGVTDEDEEFDTFEGRYRIGRRIVRDWKPLGPLTFAGVIQRSSNIGTLQVAERLGSETLRGYLGAFGFGDPTGLPFGGESRGIVPGMGVWRPIRLATVSFGQGIAVTPVQLAQGVNTIAAGGVRLPLRLIRGGGGGAQPAAAGAPPPRGRGAPPSRSAGFAGSAERPSRPRRGCGS